MLQVLSRIHYVESTDQDQKCPISCQCSEGEYGAFEIDCSNQWLTTFPDTVPAITTKLNISGNRITNLERRTGGNTLYANITVLDLSNNSLVEISTDFWRAFPNLKYLYLKKNRLKYIPKFLPETLMVLHANKNLIKSLCLIGKSLQELYLSDNVIDLSNLGTGSNQVKTTCNTSELSNLEILDLARNGITQINNQIFRRFPKLKHVSLSNNQISDASFIKELNFIEVLDLGNNSISEITKNVFENLHSMRYLSLAYNNIVNFPKHFPTLEWLDISFNTIRHLREEADKNELYPHDVILLGGNPFHCDCHLQWVKDLYDLRSYLLKYIDVNMDKYLPLCASPTHLAGKSWDILSSDQFVCSAELPSSLKEDSHQTNHSWYPELHVNFVGQTYIKIGWTPMNLDSKSKSKEIILAYRKFGKENMWTEVVVSGNVGVYTIRQLFPDTAYVICVKGDMVGSQDCVEMVTHGQSWLQRNVLVGWATALIFISISVVLSIYLCFFRSNIQKKEQ